MTKYRIKWFVQDHIGTILIVSIILACMAGLYSVVTDGTYKHGTLAVYDSYGNVKHVISGDFKHNKDGSFACKNGTIYKFENMLFERM
nr:MAG TPA: hypothetical protein [Bacteriophage sp.]